MYLNDSITHREIAAMTDEQLRTLCRELRAQIILTVGENGGRLVIDYTVEVDNSLMGENHFEMVVS